MLAGIFRGHSAYLVAPAPDVIVAGAVGIAPGEPDRATSVRANRLPASIFRQIKDMPWLKTVVVCGRFESILLTGDSGEHGKVLATQPSR
jgi:hypothetical protein